MQQTQTDPARRQAGNDKSSRACAKLNLSLHVVGQREDGYHLLDSLVTFVEEADEIRLTTPLSAEDQLEISGPFAKSLQGGSNSLHDALALLRSIAAEHACTVPPLAMHLHKKLPVASGIGGGSADAAALLRLLLPDLPDTIQKQVILNAVQLGADVPMCLFQKTAVARGIGDLLQPLANLPSMPIVLINPGIAVSTPAIFRLLEQRNNAPMPEIPGKGFATIDDLVSFLSATRNDLQKPASHLAPDITTGLAGLEASGAMLARMSGSGATVFGIYASEDAAKTAADTLQRNHPHWWVRQTRTIEDRG